MSTIMLKCERGPPHRDHPSLDLLFFMNINIFSYNQKKPSLKPFDQINQNLVGRTYGRFCIMFPHIDASCTNSLYFTKRFQRRILLEIDQPEMRIAYGGHVC
jgi:hypothetical protein